MANVKEREVMAGSYFMLSNSFLKIHEENSKKKYLISVCKSVRDSSCFT